MAYGVSAQGQITLTHKDRLARDGSTGARRFSSTTERETTMKTILATALVAAAAMFAALPASARDQGIINQAGPYEATPKFYMHPAHFFWSSEAPHQNGQHPAVLVKRSEMPVTAPAGMPSHPALTPRTHTILAKGPKQH